jgi:hypothetical protein
MADFYGLEHVGVADGTALPPKKYDFRLVSAKKRRVRSTKATGQALAVNDRLYLGKLPQGASLSGIRAIADTSLGTTTIAIGTATQPTKYATGRTLTATDVPTPIGPKASAFIAAPVDADEHLWATFTTAAVSGATVLAFDFEYSTNN